MLGEFLEVSLATADILASIAFYMRLGFQQVSVNDVWNHPYTVLGDGRLYLGLHQTAVPSPTLTFVQTDLRGKLPEFEALGAKFEFRDLGEDKFNKAGFQAPAGQMIMLLEARTYSPFGARATGTLCGHFEEYRIATQNVPASRQFWEQLGLICTDAADPHTHSARLATRGLNLTLIESPRPQPPQLVFLNQHPEEAAEQLAHRGISVRLTDNAELQLTAPEAIHILMVRDDS